MVAQDWAFIVYGMIAFAGLIVMALAFVAFNRRRRPLDPGEEYRPGRGPSDQPLRRSSGRFRTARRSKGAGRHRPVTP